MSTTATPNLALTYIVASQAQKEVTHNGALNDLDFAARIVAIDHTISTPPGSPSTGAFDAQGRAPASA